MNAVTAENVQTAFERLKSAYTDQLYHLRVDVESLQRRVAALENK